MHSVHPEALLRLRIRRELEALRPSLLKSIAATLPRSLSDFGQTLKFVPVDACCDMPVDDSRPETNRQVCSRTNRLKAKVNLKERELL